MRESCYVPELPPRFDKRLQGAGTLLLCVRTITHAFQDARRVDPVTGRITEEARDAWRWLHERPPTPYKAEPGTYAFCCHVAGYDPEAIRRRGLPKGVEGWQFTEGGIEGVRKSWAERRVRQLRGGRTLSRRILNFEESLA